MKPIILFICCFFMASTIGNSQSKVEKKEKKQQLQQQEFEAILNAVNTGNYTFYAQWAIPTDNTVQQIGLNLPGGNAVFQGNRVNLTDGDNLVTITNSKSATINLAYFGRMFIPNYGSENAGITFNGDITDYAIKTNQKKHRITINFKAKSNTENYNFTISISSKNSADVTVNSAKRQTIRYTGYVKAAIN